MAEGRGTVRLERPGRPLSGPVRDACEATDWDAAAVLDVVNRAPPLSTYENGERSARVTRLTRPLWERLR